MSATTGVSLEEYLATSYRPDCDYLEGELLERNVGEWDHSRLQMLLSDYLFSHEKQCGIVVVPEQRVQVRAGRFRIPDITVLLKPSGPIITEPPFLCIEILSPRDRMQRCKSASTITSPSACGSSGLSIRVRGALSSTLPKALGKQRTGSLPESQESGSLWQKSIKG